MTEEELATLWQQAHTDCGYGQTRYPSPGVLARYAVLLFERTS